MALRFPAKKKPKPQKPAAHPDPHVSMGDGGQDEAAPQEAFHLELDLHPEELSLLKRLSEQLARMFGSGTPRALARPRPRALSPRPRKPKAAGRKTTSVRRKVARRR